MSHQELIQPHTAGSGSKVPSTASGLKKTFEGQLKVNQEALKAMKKKHPASKYRSRYDLKMDNWKDLDDARFAREIEELRTAKRPVYIQPTSHVGQIVARKFEEIEVGTTPRDDMSEVLLKQFAPKKEVNPHKVRKLKKKEDFRISGLPRAISVQDLHAKA